MSDPIPTRVMCAWCGGTGSLCWHVSGAGSATARSPCPACGGAGFRVVAVVFTRDDGGSPPERSAP